MSDTPVTELAANFEPTDEADVLVFHATVMSQLTPLPPRVSAYFGRDLERAASTLLNALLTNEGITDARAKLNTVAAEIEAALASTKN